MSVLGIEKPVDGRRRLRIGPLAPRLDNAATALALMLAVLTASLVSLSHGTTPVSTGEVLSALFGHASEDAEFAVLEVRLPRILLGVAAGFAVAMTGAILQTLARNPLADPGLLGLSQGAIVAAMIVAVFFPALDAGWRAFGATAGALATGILILALVGPARSAGLSILLMGIAVETTLSSVSAMLIVHSPPEISYQLSVWMAGALDRASWSVLANYLPWAALVLPVLLLAGRSLRAYELGDDLARAIGEPTGMRRAAILLAAVALAGSTTAAVGPLLFLGVMGPHLARFLSPATGTARLWLAGLMGALLVTVADLGVRLVEPAIPVTLGLCLVLVGVPLFIATLRIVAHRQG